jgi:hypothetical protein
VPALQTIQLLGALGTFSYLAARACRASGLVAFHRYAVIAQPRARLPVMPAGYRVEEMTAETLSCHAIDVGAEVQARRFAEGLTCLAAFDRRDRLVGLVWLRRELYHEDEVRVRFLLPDGCCWDTGLWIAPPHRLSRAFAALWAGVGEWMAAHGLSHSLSRISDYNLAAQLAHKRMGAQTLSHHVFITLGPWQWSSDTRPRLTRRDEAATPELDLRLARVG